MNERSTLTVAAWLQPTQHTNQTGPLTEKFATQLFSYKLNKIMIAA